MSEVAVAPALSPAEVVCLRSYLHSVRQNLEQTYRGASPAERAAHYRGISDDLVREAFLHLDDEMDGEDRPVYDVLRPEIETLSWEIFRQEFELEPY